MAQDFASKPHAHLVRMAIIVILLGAAGFVGRMLLIPPTFGQYGSYRGEAVVEEMSIPIRNMTNDSCLACHPHIKKMHLTGVHRTVSCEFCHGPAADHVADGKKTGTLPVKQGAEIARLCLRCHNQIIRARPKESIRMVSMPDHLTEKRVRPDHTCAQCHNVHAPLMWINMSREMMGLAVRPGPGAGEVR